MITILNTSILTNDGLFKLSTISLDEAKKYIKQEFQSAVGHESTAKILTELLGVDITMNRMEYHQDIGDIALVFKLKNRAPEGVILTKGEIEKIGYEFKTLVRLA